MSTQKDKQCKETCRKCNKTFVPSFEFDFYPDPNGESGLCERCMLVENLSEETKPDPVQIPKDYLEKVCKFGGRSETCKYIGVGKGYLCLKGSELGTTIESRSESMKAKGDNCSGPPNFEINEIN